MGPPQPIGTSTPAESLNLEAIHRDTQNLLQDLEALQADLENDQFLEREDVQNVMNIMNELQRSSTPDKEKMGEAAGGGRDLGDQVKLESTSQVSPIVPLNPPDHATKVEIAKNESSPSTHGTDTQESMLWDDHVEPILAESPQQSPPHLRKQIHLSTLKCQILKMRIWPLSIVMR